MFGTFPEVSQHTRTYILGIFKIIDKCCQLILEIIKNAHRRFFYAPKINVKNDG